MNKAKNKSMEKDLVILAGKSAYYHIRENGLSESDIRIVLGASGAAKWLTIQALDSVLFSQWFKDRKEPLYLFGTSVGAWKFAAAAQKDPRRALDRLKDAYIHQSYRGLFTPAKVSGESRRVMRLFLSGAGIDEVLSHPFIRIGFSAVKCKNVLASHRHVVQGAGIWSAFELNLLSRKLQGLYFERTMFHDPRYDTAVMDMTDFRTGFIALTPLNFSKALLASGSIPLLMEGVTGIPGSPEGVFRDGGLLDYHPVFPMKPGSEKFILYPHFYPYLVPGWFDKKLTGRRAHGSLVDRVILVAPSPEFVARLPFGRIPDRQDFIRFKKKDGERIQAWQKAAEMGRILADAFMEAVDGGCIKDRVRMIS